MCISNYPTEIPAELANRLATTQRQQQIDQEKRNKPNLWGMIRFKLKAT